MPIWPGAVFGEGRGGRGPPAGVDALPGGPGTGGRGGGQRKGSCGHSAWQGGSDLWEQQQR